jgi:hypothetical protein
MKHRKYRSSVGGVLLLSTMFLLLLVQPGCHASNRVVGGVLDLSAWSIEAGRSVRLDGEWEFYWDRLLEPTDFATNSPRPAPMLMDLPRPWNGYPTDKGPLPGEGRATFRLLIRIGGHQRSTCDQDPLHVHSLQALGGRRSRGRERSRGP